MARKPRPGDQRLWARAQERGIPSGMQAVSTRAHTRPHTPAHARHSLMQTHVFPPAGSHRHMHPHTSTHTRTGLSTRSTLDPTRALRAGHAFCLSPLGTPSSAACGRDPGPGCPGCQRRAGPLGTRARASGQLKSGSPLKRRGHPGSQIWVPPSVPEFLETPREPSPASYAANAILCLKVSGKSQEIFQRPFPFSKHVLERDSGPF